MKPGGGALHHCVSCQITVHQREELWTTKEVQHNKQMRSHNVKRILGIMLLYCFLTIRQTCCLFLYTIRCLYGMNELLSLCREMCAQCSETMGWILWLLSKCLIINGLNLHHDDEVWIWYTGQKWINNHTFSVIFITVDICCKTSKKTLKAWLQSFWKGYGTMVSFWTTKVFHRYLLQHYVV